MYGVDDFKFEEIDEEEKRQGFDQVGLSGNVDKVFEISNYQIEDDSIRYIKVLTVRNNKFWIITSDNKLFTMKYGGLPQKVYAQKMK